VAEESLDFAAVQYTMGHVAREQTAVYRQRISDERLRAVASRVHAGIRVDDAEACVIPRLREMFRYHVLVRVPRDADTRRLLRAAEEAKALSPRVKRFSVDVDPMEML